MELLVVADDLTGALDTGVQLSRHGARVLVTTGTEEPPHARLASISVWVADTDTRHRAPAVAYRRVAACVSRGARLGAVFFYKKTDSTLRGNVGAELDAAMSACGAELLVFAPALPAGGRTTEGGVQYVNGVALSETEFAFDQLNPVPESRVDRIVASQTQRRVFTLAPGVLPAERRGIAVYDAASEADLAAIAACYRGSGVSVYAGCAGFARYLPLLVELPQRPAEPVGTARKLLVISGSRSGVSRQQVARAKEHGLAGMQLPRDAVRDLGGTAFERFATKAVDCAIDGDTLVVSAPPSSAFEGAMDATDAPVAGTVAKRDNCGGQPAWPHAGDSADGVACALAAGARRLVVDAKGDSIAVFGGDTLRQVMDALGVDSLEPVLEIAPGVVLSRPIGARSPAYLVSKAGGFGSADVISKIRRFLLEGQDL